MDKKTQLILGVGALAVVGYLLFQQSKKKQTVSIVGRKRRRRKRPNRLAEVSIGGEYSDSMV
jgi:hypothetical protein